MPCCNTPKIVNKSSYNILDKIYTHSLEGYISYIKNNIIDSYPTECTLSKGYICNTGY